MSAQDVDLIGHLFLAAALAIGVSQVGLLWVLVRRAGRKRTTALPAPSPETELDLLENEIDRLRGELYRVRNERDWLRKECARLASGEA